MQTLIFNGTELVCPRGHTGETPLVVNMEKILAAESRIAEVPGVTPAKAPELLSFFAEAARNAHDLMVMAQHQCSVAERQAARIRARIVLDEAGEILKLKGLVSPRSPAGSEDLRNAVVETNVAYQEASDKVDYLTAVAEWMKGKVKSFEKAYFDTKDNRDAALGQIGNRSFTGGAEEPNKPAGPPGSPRSQFGRVEF